MPEDRKPGQHQITITVDENALRNTTDEYLSFLWHLAQHNPADWKESPEPGELAMKIGWEIIRRWIKGVEPEMYSHQQSHWHWWQLTKLGKWLPDGKPASERKFVPHVVPPDTRIVREALEAAAKHETIYDPRKADEYRKALADLDAMTTAKADKGAPGQEGRDDG